MIQNADDAAAKKVTFVFDQTEYGKQSLFSQKMEKSQVIIFGAMLSIF
jgi:hypothetical protein